MNITFGNSPILDVRRLSPLSFSVRFFFNGASGDSFSEPHGIVLTCEAIGFEQIRPLPDLPNAAGSNWDITETFSLPSLPVGTFTVVASVGAIANGFPYGFAVSQEFSPSVGFEAQHRAGAFTIKNFNKLNLVTTQHAKFEVVDLDFINIQTLSLVQAGLKCQAIAGYEKSKCSLISQRKGFKIEEAFSLTDSAQAAFYEISRVAAFASNEIRNLQQFDLANREVLRNL